MLGSHLSAVDIFDIIIALLISMTIHEFMHAFVGYKLGDSTAKYEGRLSLNPLNHIDPLMTVILPVVSLVLFGVPFLAAKPVPFNPDRVRFGDYGAALLAVAGPVSNLVLAIIGVLIFQHVNLTSGLLNALQLFVELNVIMFVFNLVPIPPLDGSRVLFAFAPRALQEFMQMIEPYGFFIIIALVLLGGLSGFLSNIYIDVLNIISHV